MNLVTCEYLAPDLGAFFFVFEDIAYVGLDLILWHIFTNTSAYVCVCSEVSLNHSYSSVVYSNEIFLPLEQVTVLLSHQTVLEFG